MQAANDDSSLQIVRIDAEDTYKFYGRTRRHYRYSLIQILPASISAHTRMSNKIQQQNVLSSESLPFTYPSQKTSRLQRTLRKEAQKLDSGNWQWHLDGKVTAWIKISQTSWYCRH